MSIGVGMTRLATPFAAVVLLVVGAVPSVAALPPPAPPARDATCVSSVGPGIPPPATRPSGLEGFHASWYGQSGYPTLCPGERSTAVVAYYNSGARGWVSGRLGEMAFLGTWNPIPGQDLASSLGGDGTLGSPATGWPRYNRVAAQPASYVGPNQVAWFQFTIQAPLQAGTYRLYVRPLVEGANWMEDVGVFWQVTVKTGTPPPTGVTVSPTAAATTNVATTRAYTAQVTGISGCVDLAFVDAATYPTDGTFRDGETDGSGFVVGNDRADVSSAAVFASVAGVANGTSFVRCVAIPPSGSIDFTVTSSTGNAWVRPIVFVDANSNDALDLNSRNEPIEAVGVGGSVAFVPPEAPFGAQTITVGVANVAADSFTDAGGTQTFYYDTNDVFQYGSVGITKAQFEQVISSGDTVTLGYDPNPAGQSTFNLTNDVGRAAPTVQAAVDSYDSGTVADDIQLTLTEAATNVDGISYVVQRATATGLPISCDSGSGTYAQRGTVAIPTGSNTATFVERDLASGAYCYRVGATNPATTVIAWGYANPATIANPPTPIGTSTAPTSSDARLVTSAGLGSIFDAGDVIKIAFNKDMKLPGLGATIRARDADGTIGDFVCGTNAACALNTSNEKLGTTTYLPSRVLTLTLSSAPALVASGTALGLQVPATVIDSSGITDLGSNAWNIPGSADVVLGNPD